MAYRDQDKSVQEANKDNDYLLEKWEGEKSWKNAILPNAESIYEQIGVFRDSIPENNHGHSIKTYEIEQKTNNIGIMGCRGAGKTSVLKTFFHKLCTKN